MNNKSLISIIVPCYNVERYVEQCIRSIIGQSYKNIEIITVDDGSPDNSPQILDKLANEDSRIKVIHKQNAGVSAARNSGLDVATGDYIVFVDGDDYLAPDYVDYMLSLAVRDNADLVLSKNWFTRDSQPQVDTDYIETITPAAATALLISLRLIVGSHNKMYRKKFLDDNGLRFSTTLFYGEGLNFIIKAAQLANCVTTGERMVYYYRRNNESSATTKFNIQKYYNGEKSLNRIEDELIIKDDDIMLMMGLHKSVFCLGALSQTYAHHLQHQYKSDCEHWRSVIKKYIPSLLKSSKVSVYRKAMLVGGVMLPNVISKLDMWRRRRIAQNSVK